MNFGLIDSWLNVYQGLLCKALEWLSQHDTSMVKQLLKPSILLYQ